MATHGIWHYLASFIIYTLLVIGLLYGAYFYMKRNSTVLPLTKKRALSKEGLQVESVLTLEARKNLYVVRSGQERFLIATNIDGTQYLSRLADAPEGLMLPASEEESIESPEPSLTKQIDFAQRFQQSLDWVFKNRFPITPSKQMKEGR